MKILIVCSSNVCRSPYAEFHLKKQIENSKILQENIEWVQSSAVFNRSKEIFPKTKQCLVADGFALCDIEKFKPNYIKDNISPYNDADIIIGMTKTHKWLLKKQYKSKFMPLSTVAYGKYSSIPDPFLAVTFKQYKKSMDVIKNAIEQYAKNLELEFSKN